MKRLGFVSCHIIFSLCLLGTLAPQSAYASSDEGDDGLPEATPMYTLRQTAAPTGSIAIDPTLCTKDPTCCGDTTCHMFCASDPAVCAACDADPNCGKVASNPHPPEWMPGGNYQDTCTIYHQNCYSGKVNTSMIYTQFPKTKYTSYAEYQAAIDAYKQSAEYAQLVQLCDANQCACQGPCSNPDKCGIDVCLCDPCNHKVECNVTDSCAKCDPCGAECIHKPCYCSGSCPINAQISQPADDGLFGNMRVRPPRDGWDPNSGLTAGQAADWDGSDGKSPLDPDECLFGSQRLDRVCLVVPEKVPSNWDSIPWGGSSWHEMILSSKHNFGDNSNTSEFKVSCACVRWNKGCFAPGTMIKMADGSSKAVEQIAAGDLVWNPVAKKGVSVERIIESEEKLPLIAFGYADIKLRVNQNHPVLTRSGVKKASALSLDDSVLGSDGQFHKLTVIKELPVAAGQSVINFVLSAESDSADNHMVLADGIASGDLVVQLELNSSH